MRIKTVLYEKLINLVLHHFLHNLKIIIFFLLPQKSWCNFIFSNYFIGSKDHLGFSGNRIIKEGETPTTIFIAK